MSILAAVTAVLITANGQNNIFEIAVDLKTWCFTFFLYVIATNIDGERKSAKLAWSKIKELFGTAWIPQPKGTS